MAVITTIAVVATVVVGGGLLKPRKAAVVYPASWDPRVQFAVDFVVAQKGSPFAHPVAVNFVPVSEFEADVTSDEGTTDDDRSQEKQQAATFRGIGMMAGAVDLSSDQKTLNGSGILAYYSPKTEQVQVRGTDLTLMVMATLVHELTHAWQDQQYDLERMGSMTDSEARFAFRAVVEGDAMRVEDAWRATLPPEQRAAEAGDAKAAADEADNRSQHVAKILSTAMAAPYILGPTFLDGLVADGGRGRVNQALATPPRDTGVLMQPWTYGTGGSGPAVEAPATPEGRTSVREDVLGPFALYLMLADRIDPHVALAAADAWVGDRMRVETTGGGQVCNDVRIRSTGPAGATIVADALQQWDDAFANGQVSVRRDGADVYLDACDPGESAAITVPDRSRMSVSFIATRSALWAAAREQGATPVQAECLAASFIRQITAEEMAADHLPDDRMAQVKAAAGAECMH
jgi:hypothetical protein